MRIVSRRLLAKVFVDTFLAAKNQDERDRLKKSLAAYVVETKGQKQLDMLLGDIAAALAARGNVVVHVTTATALSPAQQDSIGATAKEATNAISIELIEHVDLSIIGGVRLNVPGRELDATIKRRLQSLRMQEMIQARGQERGIYV